MNAFSNRHLIVALTLAGTAATASAQILRPEADNRSGSTSAFVGGAGNPDPVDNGYNIDPSETFRVINNTYPVSDSGAGNSATANLTTQSSWTDLTSTNNRFSSIVFDSSSIASVTRQTSVTVRASSGDNINMGFRIEGLPPGQTVAVHVVASITSNGGGTGSIRLVNPSNANVMSITSGSIDQVFLLNVNGSYSFRGASSISIQRSINGTQSGSVHIVGSMTFQPATVLGPLTNAANSHRYFMLQPSSWQAAEDAAVRLNGHLVTINDAAENNWVFNNIGTPTGHALWLGLTDRAVEGTFVWVSGENAAFRNFAAGEPNNSGNEDFVQMRAGAANWNDTVTLGTELVYGVVEAAACPCDWNNNGVLNSQDLFDFLSSFFQSNADFNHSGFTNSQDFFDFLACFFGGCA